MKTLAIKWYSIKIKIKYRILHPISTAWFFAKITWLSLRNKMLIVKTEKRRSKGGYKYLGILISRCPLSKKHTYDNL
jgi:hypothetical protein